jgi:WD40 repeat protein
MGQDGQSLGCYCKPFYADRANNQTGELKHELQGHTDFVKSLTIIPGTTPYLITTSSDRSIRLWDLTSLKEGGMPKSKLPIKEHTRPVDCAAWRFDEAGHLTIWTADSMGVIKEWEIEGGKLKYVKDWKGHETSISCLHVVEDGLWSGTSPLYFLADSSIDGQECHFPSIHRIDKTTYNDSEEVS